MTFPVYCSSNRFGPARVLTLATCCGLLLRCQPGSGELASSVLAEEATPQFVSAPNASLSAWHQLATPVTELPSVQHALTEVVTNHYYANEICQDELARLDFGATEKPADAPTLQQLIDQAPRDAQGWKTVAPGPYIYREQVTLTEGRIIIDGNNRAEIRGSDRWTDWQETTIDGQTYWISDRYVAPRRGKRVNGKYVSDALDYFECHKETQDPANTGGNMINTVAQGSRPDHPGSGRQDGLDMYRYSRCKWPEQVYINGKALQQVAHDEQPRPGEFHVTQGGPAWNQRQVMLADDPRSKTVEISVRSRWLVGQRVNDVTVRNMTMRYTNGYVTGGAFLAEGQNWLIENNRFSHSEAANVTILGQNITLRDNDIFCGGNQGVSGGRGSENCTLDEGFCNRMQRNNIFFNNTESGSGNWHAAGIKLVYAHHFLVEENAIFANFGPGLWFDIDCDDNTIRSNRLVNNARGGVVIEISENPTITDNTFMYNGLQTMLLNSAAVEIWSSTGGVIANNTMISNGVGIALRAKKRGQRHGDVAGMVVRDNTIVQSGKNFEGNPYKPGRNRGQMAVLTAEKKSGQGPAQVRDITFRNNRLGFVNDFREDKYGLPDAAQQQGYVATDNESDLKRALPGWAMIELTEQEAEKVAQQYDARY